MRKVRWGVIGAGGIARRRTIPEGMMSSGCATAVVVYSPNSGGIVAGQFGLRVAADERELLESEVEAVYVASPVNEHCRQVVLAAEAGKHVLCEKPLGLNVSEAGKMVEACRTNGVKLGVGFMMRFHALHQSARSLIEKGVLGRPVFGRAQLSCWYPPIEGAWRQDPARGGGGSLMDLGCHCIDLLEMFLGRVVRVSCMTGRVVHEYPVEDTAIVTLEFQSGARGVVDCLFNVPDASSKNRLELYGSKGSILAEGTIGQSPTGSMKMIAATGEYDASQSRDDPGGSDIVAEPVNLYRAQIEAFSRAVLDDTAAPIDGEAGLWSQRVLAACYQSSAEGRTVEP